MPLPKKYFHDRLILLLLSINGFLALLCIALVFLRLGAGAGGQGYIVQYRANLGISAFKPGDVSNLVAFAFFAAIVLALQVILSIRTYPIRRELAVTILGLGLPLFALAVIVSNALLVLR
ncbi:MAG TPA: hypothetical protein VLG11_03690 [Candidatus Saccharimonadales bacterium]|nr:hypothetical protein [Candidatus Saccharimonadales bacterium]